MLEKNVLARNMRKIIPKKEKVKRFFHEKPNIIS